MPIYPYSFQLPPLNVQDIPNDGAPGEFLGISAGGALDWLPAGGGGSGDMLAANNLSELTNFATARTNIGLGTASTPTFANLTLTSPSLSSSAPVTISQTWNAVGQTFKALVVNAAGSSDANSASGSLLLDLQLGGVSKFKVGKDGYPVAADGSYNVPAYRFSGGGSTNGISLYANSIYVNAGGSPQLSVHSSFVRIGPTLYFSVGDASNSHDIALTRDGAANTLALRNGAAAQTFRVYNTFPGTGNNEFGTFNWVDQPNEFQIATGQAGSGTGRALCLRSGGGINIRIGGAPGTLVWQFGTSTGHFLAATDNSVDIGASGANRPRNVYAGSSFQSGSGNAGGLYIGAFGGVTSYSNGVFTWWNNTVNNFDRFQLGGTTDVFPAIARDGAGIKFTGAAAGSTAWIKVPPVAVSALPLAATAGAGARAFVNDALAPTFGSAVTGGGSGLVPVYSDGSAWNVG